MYPVLSQSLFQPLTHASGDAGSSQAQGFRPSVPDGADLPDRRLARDNSRAALPEHLGLGAGAMLQVSPQLMQLLGLGSASVDLNQPVPAGFANATSGTTVPAVIRKREAAEVPNHNIPPSSRRYTNTPVFALLEEVVQRCVGEGPDDTVPTVNPDVWPEIRRLGDMVFALSYTPGREKDLENLRNAGMALNTFFHDYRTLVELLRTKRPDLAPVLSDWRMQIARAAIRKAVAIPLGADGEAQYAPLLYSPIVSEVREPFESHVSQLEWRLGDLQRNAFITLSQAFFASVAAPINRAAPRNNRVLGASTSEFAGADVRGFLSGTVTCRCPEAELSRFLAMVPSAELQRGSIVNNHWAAGGFVNHGYRTTYPDRGSGGTIRAVQWQNENGVTLPLMVSDWNGVHSVSRDAGRHWLPTGAPTSGWHDDIRADGWQRLMTDRWQAHKKVSGLLWTGAGR